MRKGTRSTFPPDGLPPDALSRLEKLRRAEEGKLKLLYEALDMAGLELDTLTVMIVSSSVIMVIAYIIGSDMLEVGLYMLLFSIFFFIVFLLLFGSIDRNAARRRARIGAIEAQLHEMRAR